jgi:hypothetical protein
MKELFPVPNGTMVYLKTSPDYIDRYTVIFPDGAVFLMAEDDGFAPAYECEFTSFNKDFDDRLVNFVPERVLNNIVKHLI